jgi:hypothetical protein
MVDKERKKKKGPKKLKRKQRATQVISQKVTVNIGKSKSTRATRGGQVQDKRTQQPQVIYQPAAVPVQANQQDVLTRLNDFRDEVKVQRQHDMEGHRRQAADLVRMMNIRRAEGEQQTAVPTERQDAPPSVEDAPPSVAEAKAPAKRSGRPKGSKNRPKPSDFGTQVRTPDVVDLVETGVNPMLRSSSAPEFKPVGEPKQAAEPTPRAFPPRVPIPRGVRLMPSGKGGFSVIPADQPTIEEGFGFPTSGKPLSFS